MRNAKYALLLFLGFILCAGSHWLIADSEREVIRAFEISPSSFTRWWSVPDRPNEVLLELKLSKDPVEASKIFVRVMFDQPTLILIRHDDRAILVRTRDVVRTGVIRVEILSTEASSQWPLLIGKARSVE